MWSSALGAEFCGRDEARETICVPFHRGVGRLAFSIHSLLDGYGKEIQLLAANFGMVRCGVHYSLLSLEAN